MKLLVASPTGRTGISLHEGSDYVVRHNNARSMLYQEGRPDPAWSRVSPAVLREIDQYVEGLLCAQK
jgi:hypothetical protein